MFSLRVWPTTRHGCRKRSFGNPARSQAPSRWQHASEVEGPQREPNNADRLQSRQTGARQRTGNKIPAADRPCCIGRSRNRRRSSQIRLRSPRGQGPAATMDNKYPAAECEPRRRSLNRQDDRHKYDCGRRRAGPRDDDGQQVSGSRM